VHFSLQLAWLKCKRVTDFEILGPGGTYEPLEPEAVYKGVVNNFMAAGGDRNDTLKGASGNSQSASSC